MPVPSDRDIKQASYAIIVSVFNGAGFETSCDVAAQYLAGDDESEDWVDVIEQQVLTIVQDELAPKAERWKRLVYNG